MDSSRPSARKFRQTIAAPASRRNGLRRTSAAALATLVPALLLTGCFGFGGGTSIQHRAEARRVADESDLIGGPQAQGRPGDIVMENEHLRLIIRGISDEPQAGLAPFGGVIIDADARRLPQGQGYDHLGALVPVYNFGRTPRPTQVQIISNGNATGRALVRVVAEDDLLPSIALAAAASDAFPGADELLAGSGFDPEETVPVRIETDYILSPDARGVLVETRFYNETGAELRLAVGDLVEMRGEASPFFSAAQGILTGNPSSGFGLPNDPREVGYNRTEFVGWSSAHNAYLYHPWTRNSEPLNGESACLLFGGVTGCLHGASAAGTDLKAVRGALEDGEAYLRVPPKGEGRGYGAYRRWLFLGERDLADATRGLTELRNEEAIASPVTVVEQGSGTAIEGADVAVLRQAENDLWIPWTHARTGRNGERDLTLTPGTFAIAVQASGHPNEAAAPERWIVEIPENSNPISAMVVELPRAGETEFYTRDHRRSATPARIVVLGEDPSPERLFASTSIDDLGPTSNGDPVIFPFADLTSDPLPTAPEGVSDTALVDQDGATVVAQDVVAILRAGSDGIATARLEPGRYVAVASRGPAYDYEARWFDVDPGRKTRVLLDLPKVVDTYGWIGTDLGLRGGNSADSRSGNTGRVRAAAAEGLDVVVAADTNFVTDLGPARAEAGLAGAVGSVAGQRLFTGAWGTLTALPLTADLLPLRTKPTTGPGEALDPESINGGAVDWWNEDADGNAAPATVFGRLGERAAQGTTTFVQVDEPHHANFRSWFDQIALEFDFARGYDPEAVTESAMQATTEDAAVMRLEDAPNLYADTWQGLQAGNGRYAQRWAWRVLNDAFAFWNLGKRVTLTGASSSGTRLSPPPGNPRTWIFHSEEPSLQVSAQSPELAAAVANDLAGQRAVVSSGPWMAVELRAALVDLSGSPTTTRTFGPRIPGQVMSVNPALWGGMSDYRLEVTVTVRIQSPLWAPVEAIELFSNAAWQEVDATDLDPTGSFLSGVTTFAWDVTTADLAAAQQPATLRRAIEAGQSITTETSTGVRYDLVTSTTLIFDKARLDNLTAGGGPDLWYAVRTWGTQPLYPLAIGADGDAMTPWAFSNPVYLDLDGEGRDYEQSFDAPCAQGTTDCPNVD